jgi:hypothetical protein
MLKGRFRGIPKHKFKMRLAIQKAKVRSRFSLAQGNKKQSNDPVFKMVQRLRLYQLG